MIKIDSFLAYLGFGFIKKFDHFLPVLFHNRARLLKIVLDQIIIILYSKSTFIKASNKTPPPPLFDIVAY
ncbi:hypothetical protein C0R09_09435 [Brevibacillus laterosporus]|nr:hypothetical protein C0R09_09435 [Brevibacillus laterosporus]